jgi:trehalose 6-phosphate synthase
VTRLVAVSNRVTESTKAAGGLAVGVLAAMKSRGGLWFGWSGKLAADATAAVGVTVRDNVEFATFDLPRHDFDLYYGGFCNGTLWPLFHYFVGGLRYSQAQFDAYVRVNRLFAERLAPLLRDEDLVWVHDYHLLHLARELRARGITRPLGFFLHIPFPHIEALRALPRYGDLILAMLEYDVVGFQTARDIASFRSAVVEVLGASALYHDEVRLPQGRTRLGVFPIGVDVDVVRREARQSQGSRIVKRMSTGLRGRACVIGVDRLDYSKGLVERFEAYETLMRNHPERLANVSFLQIAPLSRSDVHAYRAIRKSLEQTAGRINAAFTETDWTPIRYLNRDFAHDVLMGFLRNAAVGVVTPVRDGMNLVAKEFVAAQDPANPGVLVLSTLAGAAEELGDALLVNPHDRQDVADAINTALDMPRDERRARHEHMIRVLQQNDIHAWSARFVAELERSRQPRRAEPMVARAAGHV